MVTAMSDAGSYGLLSCGFFGFVIVTAIRDAGSFTLLSRGLVTGFVEELRTLLVECCTRHLKNWKPDERQEKDVKTHVTQGR
jgi:hypothetical protein